MKSMIQTLCNLELKTATKDNCITKTIIKQQEQPPVMIIIIIISKLPYFMIFLKKNQKIQIPNPHPLGGLYICELCCCPHFCVLYFPTVKMFVALANDIIRCLIITEESLSRIQNVAC